MPIHLQVNNALSHAQSYQSLTVPDLSTAPSAWVGVVPARDCDPLDCYEPMGQSSDCVNTDVENATLAVGMAAQFVPVAGDAVALGASVVNLAVNPSWSNLLDVGLDVIGILPGVPALGTIRKCTKVAKGCKKVWEGWGSDEDLTARVQHEIPEIVVSSAVSPYISG